MSHSAQSRLFGSHSSQHISWLMTSNLSQQNQIFIRNTKIQHKIKKIKARFGHLVRPPAWKWRRPYSAAPAAHTGPSSYLVSHTNPVAGHRQTSIHLPSCRAPPSCGWNKTKLYPWNGYKCGNTLHKAATQQKCGASDHKSGTQMLVMATADK